MTTPRIEEMVEELYEEHHLFSHSNGDYPCLAFCRKNKKTGQEVYKGYSKGYPDDTRCTCGAVKERENVKEAYKEALTQAHQAGRDEVVEIIKKEIAIHTQLMGEWTGISITDAGIRRNKTNPHQEKVETLNDVLQALQDKE